VTLPAAEPLDALAALVDYPDAALLSRVRAGLAGLSAMSPEAATALGRFADAIAGVPIAELQERYTGTFDLDPACALDVGWHLFGDAHDRGAFMAAVREELERAGVPAAPQLPDHLTCLVRLVAREQPARAAELAALIAPAIDTVQRALARRQSPYVHVLAALHAVIAEIAAEAREEASPP
jgi:nitrate reductase molybdenum cofactor assembly chaperone NarJ/NarW